MKFFKLVLYALIIIFGSQVQAMFQNTPTIREILLKTLNNGIAVSKAPAASYLFDYIIGKIEALPIVTKQNIYTRVFARLTLYLIKNTTLKTIKHRVAPLTHLTCKSMIQVMLSFLQTIIANRYTSQSRIINFNTHCIINWLSSIITHTSMKHLKPLL